MAAELLLTIPNMKPKDPHRNFNEAERYAIYLEAKEICAGCGLITKFADGDADHIARHADGGPTLVTIGIVSLLIYNNYIGLGFLEDERTQNVLLMLVIVVDGSVPFLFIP